MSSSQPTRRQRWIEVSTLYLVMTVGTAALGWAGGVLPWLSGLSGALVALGFIMLPTEVITRRGEKLVHFGIGGRADLAKRAEDGSDPETIGQRVYRSLRQALWISALVLIPYGIGTHIWRTFQGQTAHVEARSFQRWPEELRGLSTEPLRGGQISLSASSDRMRVRWRLVGGEREITIKLILEGKDLSSAPSERVSTIISRSPGVQAHFSRLHEEGETLSIRGKRQGYVTLQTPAQVVSASAIVDHKLRGASYWVGGEYNSSLEGFLRQDKDQSPQIQGERSYQWLWFVFILQLFVVALPEEIFYRGYIQTRLDGLIGRDQRVFGVSYNWASALLCSTLFAIAHFVTIPHPARLAVFFPSLLFGWMRRAYHDTLSPAIFHAICNVFAQLLWGIYALDTF